MSGRVLRRCSPLLLCAALLLCTVLGAGCDEPAPPAEPPALVSAQVASSEAGAKAKVDALMKAATEAASSCQAGELIWDAEPSGYTIPRIFRRPCLPEVCEPTGDAMKAVAASTEALRQAVQSDVALQVASYRGMVALGEAMSTFLKDASDADKKRKASAAAVEKSNAALRGTRYVADKLADKSQYEKRDVSPMSGLSLHYRAIADAYNTLYPDAKVPHEPLSLTKSLAAEQPGGDVCKGWALPRYCDVKAVVVPAVRRWRSDPACIEMDSVYR